MQNHDDTTRMTPAEAAASTRAALLQNRAIAESEARLAAAIDAADREIGTAQAGDAASHSQEDAFRLSPATSASASEVTCRS